MAKIDRLEGAEQSYCNWSGQQIGVVTCCAEERESVAKRVAEILSAEGTKASRMDEKELEARVNGQAWFGGQKVGELTAYEFLTVARERTTAFASSETLDEATKGKLLAIVGRQWEKHAAHPATAPSDAEAYAGYWRPRLEVFKEGLAQDARELLTAEQFEHLKVKLAKGK